MRYTAKTINNKDLLSIPFEECFRMYQDAADVAAETLEQENKQRYSEFIQKKELQYSTLNEAPYEGNFSDQYPYTPAPGALETRRKAGMLAIVQEFIPRYQLSTMLQANIMSQVISWIANRKVNLTELRVETTETVQVRGTDGLLEPKTITSRKICGKRAYQALFSQQDPWQRGLFYFLMQDSRSAYIAKQYAAEGRAYCSLVPLILYAFKLHHNVKYSEWDRNTLHWVVNDSLCKAMCATLPEDLTKDDILLARAQGLLYKTGVKQGKSRDPVTTFKLYDVNGTKLKGLPDLANTMLAQIWCAHPQNRTKYMVLDPLNWDSIPAPLISEQLFAEPQKVVYNPAVKTPTVTTFDNAPW